MNSTSNNASLEYKKCAGKGCDRAGRISLRVRYLNKTGLFCDRCTEDLLISELATKVGDSSNEKNNSDSLERRFESLHPSESQSTIEDVNSNGS